MNFRRLALAVFCLALATFGLVNAQQQTPAMPTTAPNATVAPGLTVAPPNMLPPNFTPLVHISAAPGVTIMGVNALPSVSGLVLCIPRRRNSKNLGPGKIRISTLFKRHMSIEVFEWFSALVERREATPDHPAIQK